MATECKYGPIKPCTMGTGKIIWRQETESSIMQMEISITVNGSVIRRKVMAHIPTVTAQYMKGNGAMISNTALVLRIGQMEVVTRATTLQE
jgi:hypothetical protein